MYPSQGIALSLSREISLHSLNLSRCVAVGVVALVLCGCAHVGPAPGDLLLLRSALMEDAATLRARAEQGDARAQMGLALVYRYGFSNARIDVDAADRWQRKATAKRGSTPITTYIAGLNGKPGRVSTIYVPRYDVSPVNAAQASRCAALLALEAPVDTAAQACGGEDTYLALRALKRGP